MRRMNVRVRMDPVTGFRSISRGTFYGFVVPGHLLAANNHIGRGPSRPRVAQPTDQKDMAWLEAARKVGAK